MANLYTSGVSPTSGTEVSGSQVFPGPHFVEEQRLTFQYIRVPSFGGLTEFQASSVTLSGIDDLRFQPGNDQTILIGVVKASYEVRKDTASYDTSTYFQTQEVEFIGQASADPYGRTYGTAADASAAYDADTNGKMDISAVGIEGTMVTSRPYIRRRPWVEGTDVEVYNTCTGTTFTFSQDTNVLTQYAQARSRDFNFDQQDFQRDYYRYVGNLIQVGSLTDQDDVRIANKWSIYNINQGFAYSKDDTAALVVNAIKDVAELVRLEALYKIPTTVNTSTTPPTAVPDEGVSQFKFDGRITFANWDGIV